MSRITIAGNFELPEHLELGEYLTITARVYIHSLNQDRINVTALGDNDPSYILGEIQFETVASTCLVEKAAP